MNSNQSMTKDSFASETNVSRETLERLGLYALTLEKWQKKINLVSRTTLPDLWRRHFLDSAQVFDLLPDGTKTVVDLGTGAGFPGLVLAIMGVPDVHLVESDQRKCAFLREVARVTNTSVTIHNSRIEKIQPWKVDVVTARALASLDKLLEYAAPFTELGANCVFLKGKNAKDELTEAKKAWHMEIDVMKSRSEGSGAILQIREVRRATGSIR